MEAPLVLPQYQSPVDEDDLRFYPLIFDSAAASEERHSSRAIALGEVALRRSLLFFRPCSSLIKISGWVMLAL